MIVAPHAYDTIRERLTSEGYIPIAGCDSRLESASISSAEIWCHPTAGTTIVIIRYASGRALLSGTDSPTVCAIGGDDAS